ncbi:hypothetical protein GLYMA_04G082250v4 [Glycine max]|nr:hypothetical protein GLYMA_04G082250v4 [Glycine max]KAH1110391.1 hypothetical protein GYH30_009315 [Glycine max]
MRSFHWYLILSLSFLSHTCNATQQPTLIRKKLNPLTTKLNFLICSLKWVAQVS